MTGSFANSEVDSVIQDGHWNWGYARSESLVTILSQLPLIEIGDEDTTWWVSSKTCVFSVASAWIKSELKGLRSIGGKLYGSLKLFLDVLLYFGWK